MASPGEYSEYSVHVLDHPAWRSRRTYVAPLAVALHAASDALRSEPTNPDGPFIAYKALLPFRKRAVCLEQRLRLEYHLALSYQRTGDKLDALASLARARESAAALKDWDACVTIGRLEGTLNHLLTQHAAAYNAYASALAALRYLTETQNGALAATAAEHEIDLILRLAGRAWELGWFTTCLRHADEAHTLRATSASNAAQPAATLAWLDAQMARVRGAPVQAFSLACSATEIFQSLNQKLNAGRIQTITAECALDLVEACHMLTHPEAIYTGNRLIVGRAVLQKESAQLLQRYDPRDLLALARKAAARGLALAKATQDTGGKMMARLARRRCERLTALLEQRSLAPDEGIALTDEAARAAARLHDPSLHGRAKTMLGEELAMNGQMEAARGAYYHAQLYLEEYQLGGLAFWPRSALWAANN